MAAVHALADVQPHLPALARLGYEHRHTGMSDRLFLCRSRGGTRTHHLHVVPLSTWDTRNERLFRDFLRAHPDVAARYAALKRDAAARHGAAAGYTREKTAFVQAVVDAARDRAGLPRVPVWEK